MEKRGTIMSRWLFGKNGFDWTIAIVSALVLACTTPFLLPQLCIYKDTLLSSIQEVALTGKMWQFRWKPLDIRPLLVPMGLSLFATVPPDVLHANVFSFLSVNEVTNLGMTSLGMSGMVSRSRSIENHPCALWQTRRATHIQYRGLGENYCSVYQTQRFRFALRNSKGENFQVKFSLFNIVWEEHNNMRDGALCRPRTGFSSQTFSCIRIYKKLEDGTRVNHCDFNIAIRGADHGRLVLRGGQGVKCFNSDSSIDVNPDDSTVRENLSLVFISAKQVAAFRDDGLNYPSAEYLMRLLPKSVYRFFPEDFDWELEHTARIFQAEFSYRPSRTLREWRRYAASARGQIRVYIVDQVPWYRAGYKYFYEAGEESDDDDDDDDDDGEN